MKNWDAFIIVSTSIIALTLFASGRVEMYNMLDNLTVQATLVAMLKTVAIVISGSLIIASMIVILLLDIVTSVIMRMEFPIIHYLYQNYYIGVVREWYWDANTGSHILMACIILFGIGLINTYLGPVYRKKTFIYHKNKESNYYSH